MPAPLLDSIVPDRSYKSLGGTRRCHPGADDARNDGDQYDDPGP